MTGTIWKYQTALADTFECDMPRGSKVLSVQMQHDCWVMWAHIPDPQAVQETRHFAFYGTGNPCPSNPGVFIATIQMAGGGLVFHLFDRGTTGKMPA